MNSRNSHAVTIIKALSFGLDIAAFVAALFLAPIIFSFFSDNVSFFGSDAPRSQAVTLALAVCFMAFFSVTGKYTKRKPLWGLILSVVRLSFILLAIDIIVRSAANYGHPSLYPLVYWPIALTLMVVFRFVLNVVKIR